jgi:hypothetical protein
VHRAFVLPCVAVIAAVAACAREAPIAEPRCGTSRTITGDGIGDFRIGMTIDSLRASCVVTADSTNPRGMEGMPERRVTVQLDSTAVSGLVVDDIVRRIDIDRPTFRTAAGHGVNSTLAELRPLAVEIVSGEGNVAAVSPNVCGVSFLLDVRPAPADPRAESLPDTTRVRRVLIIGCDSPTNSR